MWKNHGVRTSVTHELRLQLDFTVLGLEFCGEFQEASENSILNLGMQEPLAASQWRL